MRNAPFPTSSTYLSTVDVHVLRVLATLPEVGPLLAVDVTVLALDIALVAGHGTVDQHPARVLLTLVQAGPGGAVLVGVLAAGLHPGLDGGLDGGPDSDGATAHLRVA